MEEAIIRLYHEYHGILGYRQLQPFLEKEGVALSKLTDARLAIDTLGEALGRTGGKRGILLHSNQGCQYTPAEFREYCGEKGMLQSMSRAGCPYDNAPMERFFNTLKTERVYQKYYQTEAALYQDILSFSYGWYNNVRPHTYNGGLPPAKVL